MARSRSARARPDDCPDGRARGSGVARGPRLRRPSSTAARSGRWRRSALGRIPFPARPRAETMADNRQLTSRRTGFSRDRRALLSTGYATRRLGAALGLVGLVPRSTASSGAPRSPTEPGRTRLVGLPVAHRDRRDHVLGRRGLRRERLRRQPGHLDLRHDGGTTTAAATASSWTASAVPSARSADNGYFPRHMTPRQNPFYLDLPFDDINNSTAFAQRSSVVPWAPSPASPAGPGTGALAS